MCILCIVADTKQSWNWIESNRTILVCTHTHTHIVSAFECSIHVIFINFSCNALLQLYHFIYYAHSHCVRGHHHHYGNSVLFMNFQWSVCKTLALCDQIINDFKFEFIENERAKERRAKLIGCVVRTQHTAHKMNMIRINNDQLVSSSVWPQKLFADAMMHAA